MSDYIYCRVIVFDWKDAERDLSAMDEFLVVLDADVCAEAKCSHLCLPSTHKRAGYSCACPTDVFGYRMTLNTDERTCRAVKGQH